MAAAKTEYPNAWVPTKAGESITGKLLEVRVAYSDQRAKNGDGNYPLLLLELADGSVKNFHAFQTVAYNIIREKQPIPGETLTITYDGEGKEKNGNNAPKLFRMSIEGRSAEDEAASAYERMFKTQPQLRQAETPQDEIPF